MIRLATMAGRALVGLGLLFCVWGLIGTIQPPANGGYEATRFVAKFGAMIGLSGLLIIVASRRR